jgi:tape measure domain-containing protein
MGEIKETLVLSDQFSESFSKFLELGNAAVNQMKRIDHAVVKTEMTMRRSIGGATGAVIANLRQIGDTSNKFLDLGNSAVKQMKRIDDTMNKTEANMRKSIGGAADSVIENMKEIGQASNKISSSGFDRMETQLIKIAGNTEKAATAQDKHNNKVKETSKSAVGLFSTLKKVVSVASNFKMGKELFSLSDQMTRSTARLGVMNQGFNPPSIDAGGQGNDNTNSSLQETEALQEKIYRSAQRSRTSYLDTADVVAKLGQSAGNAFSGSDEVVAVAENLSKQFKIAGASQEEIGSATEQLGQALASGVLSGEELNTVFKGAPNAIQAIADYLGKPVDEISGLADKGVITAEVVKNSLLNATDQINEQFKNMPMTWSDSWNLIKNAGIHSLDGVLDKMSEFLNSETGQTVIEGIIGAVEFLGDVASGAVDILVAGANAIVENWDYIYPILMGIGLAFALAGTFGLVSGLVAASGWLAAAMPFVIIGLLIGAVILGIMQAGVTFEKIGEKVGYVFGFIYAVGYNMIADLWNLIAIFAEFFANIMNDPASAIAHLLFGLFDNILSQIETVADAIDAVFKTNMADGVKGFRNQLSEWVDDEFGEQAYTIERMTKLNTGDTADEWSKKGNSLGNKIDNTNFSLDSLLDKIPSGDKLLGGIGAGAAVGDIANVGKVGKVDKIEQDVNISDENIKLLRDLSERQYVALVNLTVPQTNATVNQNNYGGPGSDLDSMVNVLNNVLGIQHASSSNVVTG